MSQEEEEEVLKPGALYAECAVVKLNVSSPPLASSPSVENKGEAKKNETEGNKGKSKANEHLLDIPDDGEFGGEAMGRAVWEAYEEALKTWEKDEKAQEK